MICFQKSLILLYTPRDVVTVFVRPFGFSKDCMSDYFVLFFIQPMLAIQPLSCMQFPVIKIFYFFLLLSGFSWLYIYSVTSLQRQREGFKGHCKVERAEWVRGFGFTWRVEDFIYPKKTGAAIWVEVMDISMHADRIGGSVGGERPLKTKWTKSSWFECSSAYTLPNVLYLE